MNFLINKDLNLPHVSSDQVCYKKSLPKTWNKTFHFSDCFGVWMYTRPGLGACVWPSRRLARPVHALFALTIFLQLNPDLSGSDA